MECMGVASGCGEQEVGVGSGSGYVATGCGCKEVYRFHHNTYPIILLLYFFCSSIPISFFKKMFFVLVSI